MLESLSINLSHFMILHVSFKELKLCKLVSPIYFFQQTGLRLTLNLISEDYVALLSPSVGLRVLIHDPWEAPFPEEGGFNLSPGQSHSVTVNRVG